MLLHALVTCLINEVSYDNQVLCNLYLVYETHLAGHMGDNKTHHFTPFLLAKPEEGGLAYFLLNMSHLPSCGILIPKMPLHLIPVIEEPSSCIIA